MNLKQKWGFKDPRLDATNCELCANDTFRESWKETGVAPKAFQPPTYHGGSPGGAPPAANGTAPPADREAMIQAITERVMETLSKR